GGARDRTPGRRPERRRSRRAVRPRFHPRAARTPPRIGPDRRLPPSRRAPRPRRTTKSSRAALRFGCASLQARLRPTAAVEVEEERIAERRRPDAGRDRLKIELGVSERRTGSWV